MDVRWLQGSFLSTISDEGKSRLATCHHGTCGTSVVIAKPECGLKNGTYNIHELNALVQHQEHLAQVISVLGL